MILDGSLKDGEYKFYEDLGNGWVEEIKPPISAYSSINIDELNQVIERFKKIPNYDELIRDNNKKDKEIERLNNVINELEKWLEEQREFIQTIDMMPNLKEIKLEHKIMFNDYNNVLDKLKELKEGK